MIAVRAAAPHGAADDFAEQTGPAGGGTTVAVGALVAEGREELADEVAVGGVDFDGVVADGGGAAGGGGKALDDGGDAVGGKFAGGAVFVAEGKGRRGDGFEVFDFRFCGGGFVAAVRRFGAVLRSAASMRARVPAGRRATGRSGAVSGRRPRRRWLPG
jgi:hypothetical protein